MSTPGILSGLIINSDDFYHRGDVLEKVAESFEAGETEAIYGDVRFEILIIWIGQFRYYSSKGLSHPCFDLDLCLLIQLFYLSKIF